jgi:hypothetical protein
MKIFKTALLAVGLCLSLSGCKSPSDTANAPASFRVLLTEGSYTHRPSGMEFPPDVGDFRRVNIIQYDAKGLDVSGGYNFVAERGGIAATVYVYPAPSLVSVGSPAGVVASARATLCSREFEARKREVAYAHPGARLISERDAVSSDGLSMPGKMASFEFEDRFDGRRQPLNSDLYVFCYVGGRWAIEYRFTSPKNFDSADRIAKFMSDLRWTIAERL